MNTTGAVASVHRLICHVSILDHGNKHTFRLSRADVGNPGQRVTTEPEEGNLHRHHTEEAFSHSCFDRFFTFNTNSSTS